MRKLKFTVEDKSARMRLDRFLVRALGKEFSRTFIKKLINGGFVLVNGKNANAHRRVSAGDSTEVSIPPPEPAELIPEKIPFDIVYEDKDIMVIDKPAGLAVHPAGNSRGGTLVNALLYRSKDLSGIGGVLRPGIVHRLDRETSGLMVVAKTDAAHRNLSGQFKNRKVKKTYIALVMGCVQLDNGRIDLPLARKKTDVTRMGVSFTDEKKKRAVTGYKVLKRMKGFTVLEISLETGRTHQIRVHLTHEGYPLLGDRLYGSARKAMARQALHASKLGFYHPGTKKFMEFESRLPHDMQSLIDRGEL